MNKFRFLILLIAVLSFGAVTNITAQTQTNNYVITQAPLISGITNDSLMAAKNTSKSNTAPALPKCFLAFRRNISHPWP